jgi:ketosteroid isomerase-like protein
MGEESIDLVRRAFSAFAERDLAAVAELVGPDVEFFPPTAAIAGHDTPYHGEEGLREYFDDVARIWEVLEVVPHEYREVGDQVVALGRVYGRGRDGLLVDSPTGWIWTIDGGKIVAGRVYTSRQEALDAAGLGK